MTNLDLPEKEVPVSVAEDEKIPEMVVRPALKKTVSFADDEKTPEKAVRPALSIKKTASFSQDEKLPEKSVRPALSIKKTSSFEDKPLDTTASRKPESALPRIEPPSAKPPAFQPTYIKRQGSTRPGFEETEADAWEQAELAKIEERYVLTHFNINLRLLHQKICLKFRALTSISDSHGENCFCICQ